MSNKGLTMLGGILAAFLSYAKWHSVVLAMVHGALLGWIYVIYFFIRYGLHNLQF